MVKPLPLVLPLVFYYLYFINLLNTRGLEKVNVDLIFSDIQCQPHNRDEICDQDKLFVCFSSSLQPDRFQHIKFQGAEHKFLRPLEGKKQ